MLDLLALAKPLAPVRFPNGREVPCRPLDAEGWEKVRRAQLTGDGNDAMAAIRACLPDATDADLTTLGIEDVGVIIQYAARQILLAQEALGNSTGGGEVATPTPPSNR